MRLKILSLLLLVPLCGCAHALNIDIKGHNLETPYGKLEDGEIHVHTMWGNKNSAVVTPVSSATGSSANASIPVTLTVTPK